MLMHPFYRLCNKCVLNHTPRSCNISMNQGYTPLTQYDKAWYTQGRMWDMLLQDIEGLSPSEYFFSLRLRPISYRWNGIFRSSPHAILLACLKRQFSKDMTSCLPKANHSKCHRHTQPCNFSILCCGCFKLGVVPNTPCHARFMENPWFIVISKKVLSTVGPASYK